MAGAPGWPESLAPAGLPPLPPGCGRRIEKAWRLADGRLLLIGSQDSPYEEQLTITLLDAAGRVQDRRSLGGAYTPGWLERAEATGPGDFAFRFPDDREWRLSVRDAGGDGVGDGGGAGGRGGWLARRLRRPLLLVAPAR